jgi:hypothetical protein
MSARGVLAGLKEFNNGRLKTFGDLWIQCKFDGAGIRIQFERAVPRVSRGQGRIAGELFVEAGLLCLRFICVSGLGGEQSGGAGQTMPDARAIIHAMAAKTTAITIKPTASPILSGKPSGFVFVGSFAIIRFPQ